MVTTAEIVLWLQRLNTKKQAESPLALLLSEALDTGRLVVVPIFI